MLRGIIVKRSTNGGIAQLARATGSYPVGHGFKSNSRYQRPVGQAAKTPPFHGGNGSSILPRVTNAKKNSIAIAMLFFFALILMGIEADFSKSAAMFDGCKANGGV